MWPVPKLTSYCSLSDVDNYVHPENFYELRRLMKLNLSYELSINLQTVGNRDGLAQ